MSTVFPFLTAADPVARGEGTLDPIGLYQVSDQLATILIPAVRERMIRIRFLTAIAVSTLVTRGFRERTADADAAPHLAWEWHIVEAIVRSRQEVGGDDAIRGVPGTVVARRAIGQHGYLDARSYLSTPRVFGFHGVYKRLAYHLGITSDDLGDARATERLVDAWAHDRGLGGIRGAEPLIAKWSGAVERSLSATPPSTQPSRSRWKAEDWLEIAQAFLPDAAGPRERKCLRAMLLEPTAALGALPEIWSLQQGLADDSFDEASLHDQLEAQNRTHAPLLQAIRAYEAFARSMHDAFDVLRHRAGGADVHGFPLTAIAPDADFRASIAGLPQRFAQARAAMDAAGAGVSGVLTLFTERFAAFEQPMEPAETAAALKTLHEKVQREKSMDGKRPWFDSMGGDRIRVRHGYRIERPQIMPGKYLHAYRGAPIRRFFKDLGGR